MAALAAGPFLYRALLPAEQLPAAGGCGFLALTGSLCALFAGAALWQQRRLRGRRRRQLDRRLWEAALGGAAPLPPGDGGDDEEPQAPADGAG